MFIYNVNNWFIFDGYFQPIIAPALAAKHITLLQGFMNSTCVKFVPRTKETDYITIGFWTRLFIQLVNFILQLETCFTNKIYLEIFCISICSCSLFIGRDGGQQFVDIRPLCFPSAHELMNVLGFEKEEIRRDRDYYMALNWTNIPPGIKK